MRLNCKHVRIPLHILIETTKNKMSLCIEKRPFKFQYIFGKQKRNIIPVPRVCEMNMFSLLFRETII